MRTLSHQSRENTGAVRGAPLCWLLALDLLDVFTSRLAFDHYCIVDYYTVALCDVTARCVTSQHVCYSTATRQGLRFPIVQQ